MCSLIFENLSIPLVISVEQEKKGERGIEFWFNFVLIILPCILKKDKNKNFD